MRDTQNPETPQNKMVTTQAPRESRNLPWVLLSLELGGAGMGINGEVLLLRVTQWCPIPADSEIGHLARVRWALANSGD